MNETENKTETPTTKENYKPRGSNRQPKRQRYFAEPSREIKRATEMYQFIVGRKRLTPEERGALAFFTYQVEERGEN